MKKLCAVVLLALVAGAASGLDLSAGGGISLGSFSATTSYENYLFDSQSIVATTVPIGLQAFFDATYGLAAIGLKLNGNTHTKTTTVDFFGELINENDDENRAGFLSLSLLGRYPFALGPISLFPLLGIEYDLNLYWKDVDGVDLKTPLTDQQKADLNQLWFKAGVGADITVLKGLFIRPQVLLGFKLLSQGERDSLQTAIDAGATLARKTDFVIEAGVQAGWRF